ncbi:MAG TPA: nuclear transport factor 2 family protein [Steroidobacteraceae bacterium]|nr:nuclear transport factor 2 family protein [Steroidobacteraceae bacterium]
MSVATDAMGGSIGLHDRQAIEDLLSRFAWHADRGEGAALGALFLEDGVLEVGGSRLQGPAQIGADCQRRFTDPHRKTRHLWTNLRIERADPHHIVTGALQLTFEQSTPGLPAQLRVNDLFDEFQRDAAGHWRFAQRRIVRALGMTLAVAPLGPARASS